MPLIPVAMALAQFVPSIIKLLSGSDKAEEIAGKVVDVAEAVTGTSLSTPEAVNAAFKADPNKVLDFQMAMSQQQVDLEKAYLADMQSARDMQIAALNQEDTFSKRFVYYFAMGWSVFAGVYFLLVTFMRVPPEGQRIADTILGVLIGTVLVGIFHYFFGSTNGSRYKSELLAKK